MEMKGKKFVTWLLACSLGLGMAGEPAAVYSQALQEGKAIMEQASGEADSGGEEGTQEGVLKEDEAAAQGKEGTQDGVPKEDGAAAQGQLPEEEESVPEQLPEEGKAPKERLIAIDSARFPDPAFAAYLLETVDTDKDGQLSAEEVAGMVSMDVSGLGILDLKGIEVFWGLKSLDCSRNSLIELDLSALDRLEEFVCEGNVRVVAAEAGNRFALPFTLPGSEARVAGLRGASWDTSQGNGFFTASAQEVTYTYDTGSRYRLPVTVQLEQFAQDIAGASIGKIPDVTYTGKAVQPRVTLTYQGKAIPQSAYSVTYKNNVDAGTAQVTVTGKGAYTGVKQASFRILPKSMKKLSCPKIPKKTYTGKKIEPSVQLKDGGKKLKRNKDYVITYKDNKQTGKATAKITGKGNYTGTIQRTFQILPRKVSSFKAGKRTANSITLKWKKSASVTGYQVYQYQTKSKKYKKIKTLKAKSVSMVVKKLAPCTSYKFKIRAYKKSGKSTYYGAYSKVLKVQTRVSAPSLSVVSERKGQARISWGKVKKASGLELSYRKGKEGFKKISKVSRNVGDTLYMFKLQEGASYTFRIRAYRESGGKKEYGPYCQRTVSISSQGSALNGGNYSPGSVYGPSLSQAELNQVREKVQEFKDHYIDDTMTDYMKVKMAHDYLASVCSYAPSWALNRANTAWGALVYGEAQCSGYARAMKALCDGIGIGCYYVHADANSSNPSHQWNEVCVNGKWYIIDVQCNDSSGFYAVFLVSDDTFARQFGTSWDRNSVPPCPEDYRPWPLLKPYFMIG